MREMGGLILRNDGGTAYNRAYLASCFGTPPKCPFGALRLPAVRYLKCVPLINIGVGQNEATDLYRHVCHWWM
ncbi:hypothetical protein HKBW3S42_00854 [Candidatus Hakubella thermalkaliphila]|uniref:Uncharacterized protein n=1 Tax=Candidatus Hakubella thermalkaliphila TaxID=2754717 RepID=A0A6V8PXJ2_9ACTN|nr:hypothetical protein [Actinomycetota bacterium]GFP30709.1 hypothetical protein HKBW3S34_01629 [Candidatus Hakubella thermalkaliphila]GFP32550.1 hypothetical protein HKBW3S42_00854 [Candidatus Hakubella thermalkaliphila]GFP37282.1 hypothetical protein HKBW3S44_00962 [Candidatus Hakubella thermalkaliphila]GFP40309.1 hypothetical protein HKBW3S47_02005 [Candidatus Hakubella thermalkaliphila]